MLLEQSSPPSRRVLCCLVHVLRLHLSHIIRRGAIENLWSRFVEGQTDRQTHWSHATPAGRCPCPVGIIYFVRLNLIHRSEALHKTASPAVHSQLNASTHHSNKCAAVFRLYLMCLNTYSLLSGMYTLRHIRFVP